MRAWLALLLLIGCNQVYDLDPTTARPPMPTPPDRDLDGIADEDDNCRDVGNDTQDDGDGDGFGDACDGCPFPTLENHDEDHDGRGDDCDVCPYLPDFMEDSDGDGTGDRCEFVTAVNWTGTTLVAFEGFGVRKPAWYSPTIEWKQVGDSIAPVATTPLEDPGLRNDGIGVATSEWSVVVGATATRRWSDGDRVAVAVVDDGGTPLFSCSLVCSSTACAIEARSAGGAFATNPKALEPVETFGLRSGNGRVLCVAKAAAGAYITDVPNPYPAMRLRPALYSSPGMLIDYIALYEER